MWKTRVYIPRVIMEELCAAPPNLLGIFVPQTPGQALRHALAAMRQGAFTKSSTKLFVFALLQTKTFVKITRQKRFVNLKPMTRLKNRAIGLSSQIKELIMMSKWVKGYKLICNSRGVYSLQDKKFGKTDYCVGPCVCVPRFQTYTNPLSEGRNWKWEHECEANGYELSNCYAAGPLHVSVYEYKAPSNCINVLAKDPDEAFIKYCGLHEYPSPDQGSYGWARLCQVIGNFFGGSLSVGIKPYTHDV